MGFFPGKASEYRRKRRSLTGTVPGKECFMKSYTIHLIRHGICEGNLEGRYVGRTQYDSPEVDQEILIPASERRLLRGHFYDVTVTSAADYDLYGEIAAK